MPYVRSLANLGWKAALRADSALALGLNTVAGEVVNAAVAQAHGLAHRELGDVLV
jgi:alanine dehydrogenase